MNETENTPPAVPAAVRLGWGILAPSGRYVTPDGVESTLASGALLFVNEGQARALAESMNRTRTGWVRGLTILPPYEIAPIFGPRAPLPPPPVDPCVYLIRMGGPEAVGDRVWLGTGGSVVWPAAAMVFEGEGGKDRAELAAYRPFARVVVFTPESLALFRASRVEIKRLSEKAEIDRATIEGQRRRIEAYETAHQEGVATLERLGMTGAQPGLNTVRGLALRLRDVVIERDTLVRALEAEPAQSAQVAALERDLAAARGQIETQKRTITAVQSSMDVLRHHARLIAGAVGMGSS